MITRLQLKSILSNIKWVRKWDSKNDPNSLINELNNIGVTIRKSTLCDEDFYIIVSPEVGYIIEKTEYFSPLSYDDHRTIRDIQKIGRIHNKYLVYRDFYIPVNTVLIAHNNENIDDNRFFGKVTVENL